MKTGLLFLTFLKIGAFTFGGGYAMLPMIQTEVLRHGWMQSADLIDFIAVSESTPGPFAVNIATYVGMRVGGLPGAFCATLGVVLPSFLLILLLAKSYAKFQKNRWVVGCLSGLKPATVGLIGASVFSVGQTVLFPNGLLLSLLSDPTLYTSVLFFGVLLFLSHKKVHPILLLCLSAGIGMLSALWLA